MTEGASAKGGGFSSNMACDSATTCCPLEQKPRPTKFCDLQELAIEFHETEGGSQKVITKKATRSLRGDEIPEGAPAWLKGDLTRYDLVLEVLAPDSSRTLGSHTFTGTMDGLDPAVRKDRDKSHPQWDDTAAKAAPVTGRASWKVSCKPEHAQEVLTWSDEGHDQRVQKGSPLTQEVFCKPLGRELFFLPNLFDQLLNGEFQAHRYELTAPSCAYPAPGQGKPVGTLTALIVAKPTGAFGFKLEVGPIGWNLGWNLSEAREKAGEKREEKKAELENVVNGNGAGYYRKPRGRLRPRAARVKDTAAKKQAVAARSKAGADLKLLESTRSKIAQVAKEWEGEEREVEFAIVIADRVLSLAELRTMKRELGIAVDALEWFEFLWKRAKSIMAFLNSVWKFASEYSPAVLQPKAFVAISLFNLDFFLGTKFTSGGELDGARYRALSRYWDFEVEATLLDITGGFGFVFGKTVLGIGASLEAMVTLELKLYLDGEAKSLVEGSSNWGTFIHQAELEVKGQGQLSATAEVQAKATAFYYPLAGADGRVDSSVSVRASLDPFKLRDKSLHDAIELSWDAPPAMASFTAYWFFHKKEVHYEYEIWEGSGGPIEF